MVAKKQPLSAFEASCDPQVQFLVDALLNRLAEISVKNAPKSDYGLAVLITDPAIESVGCISNMHAVFAVALFKKAVVVVEESRRAVSLSPPVVSERPS